MTPLLFAAALAVSPAIAYPSPSDARTVLNHPVTPPPSAACAKLDTQTVAPDGVRLFKRLDQLPWAVLEHAVWRRVGGCPVREIVYLGRTWYVTSASPQVERLDPVAHPRQQR